jgi:hypothetical protein
VKRHSRTGLWLLGLALAVILVPLLMICSAPATSPDQTPVPTAPSILVIPTPLPTVAPSITAFVVVGTPVPTYPRPTSTRMPTVTMTPVPTLAPSPTSMLPPRPPVPAPVQIPRKP